MAKKAPAKSKAKTRETLVVGSKVRDYIKSQGKMTSGELIDALSEKVHELLDSAIKRTDSNGRSTVRSHDL